MAVDGEVHQMNDEDWKIACHEAGHAVFAITQRMREMWVEWAKVGENEYGEIQLVATPHDSPDDDWTANQLVRYQLYYAAGAAAEQHLFQQHRLHAIVCDFKLHKELESLLKRNRPTGFDDDIEAAMQSLDPDSVRTVAQNLFESKLLTGEQVAGLIGVTPPWK